MPEIHFKIVGDKLLVWFEFDAGLRRKFKTIPESLGKQFNMTENAWQFPIESAEKLVEYIAVPDYIIDEGKKIISAKNKPNFTIKVGCSISKLIKNGNFAFTTEKVDLFCSFDIESARFSDFYRQGLWDGRYHLFDKRNYCFPSGILQNIIEGLEDEDYTYEIIEPDYAPRGQINCELQNISLRDYQNDAICGALRYKRGLIQIPTGGGKSAVIAGIIQAYGLKTLLFVHTTDLLYQSYYNLKNYLKGIKIGMIGDGIIDIGDVTVCTIQSIANKVSYVDGIFADETVDLSLEYLEDDIIYIKAEKPTNITRDMVKSLLEDTPLLILDETQIAPCVSFYKIAMTSNARYRFGLSATLHREDGFDLKMEAAIGERFYKITASELIEKGYLVKPHIKFIKLPMKSYPRKATYQQVYKDYIVDNDERNTIIAGLAENEISNERQILILVTQKRHLQLLYKKLPKSEFIWGAKSSDERKDILDRFRNKKFQVLIATGVGDVGLDLPIASCLILAGGGKSSIKAIQRIGRVIRLSDQCPNCHSYDIEIRNINEQCICRRCNHKFNYRGKQDAVIYDFIDNTGKFLYQHYLKRREQYQSEPAYEITEHKIGYS